MATLGYKPPQTTARTSVSFDALQEASRSAASVRCRRLVEIFVCEVVAAFKKPISSSNSQYCFRTSAICRKLTADRKCVLQYFLSPLRRIFSSLRANQRRL